MRFEDAFEHNPPLPALAHHQHTGESHRLSTKAGQVPRRPRRMNPPGKEPPIHQENLATSAASCAIPGSMRSVAIEAKPSLK